VRQFASKNIFSKQSGMFVGGDDVNGKVHQYILIYKAVGNAGQIHYAVT
jgi:hypothetical protein